MLAEVEDTPAFEQVVLAHRFMALTAMRSNEVRQARWEQFEGLNTDKPVWRVPEEVMKMKRRGDHRVPLSRQAVEVIRAARSLFGKYPFVFPHTSKHDRCISGHTLCLLLKRAGYHGKHENKARRHCPHGWRSTFSTNLHDIYPEQSNVIEAALAHFNRDRTAAAYNRGDYFERRRQLMQEWADLIMMGAAPAMALLGRPKRADLAVKAEADAERLAA